MNKFMALVGQPVSHSWSPALFNYVFDRSRISADYFSMSVGKNHLERFIKFSRENCFGFNVTMPHKGTVIPLIDEVDPEAMEIGAVNVVANDNGHLIGFNTDFSGFSRFLVQAGIDFQGRSILFVGGGGAFRAVRYAINKNFRPGEESVLVRDPGKYRDGPEGVRFLDYGGIPSSSDFVINCSPVGMVGISGPAHLPEPIISGCETFIDLIYNPVRTGSVILAKRMGKRAFSGLDMFLYQAEDSFEKVFNTRADHVLFKESIERITGESHDKVQG